MNKKLPGWIDQIDEGGYSEGSLDNPEFKIIQARWNEVMSKKPLTCIIAGGRDINDYQLVLDAVKESGFDIGTVVSGGAKGVDTLGEMYSEQNMLNLKIFRPDWDTHGRAAGPIRNRKMAENAEALIAIWDGKSRGTKNMIETAKKLGLLVYVKMV